MTQSTVLLGTATHSVGTRTQPLVGWRLRGVVGLFSLSGSAALVDQVCFSKYLGYVVGSTAYAVSAVLAAFMAGMMLGAHLGGKWSTRMSRPLVAYGLAELGVALSIALAPWAFAWLTPAYVALARSSDGSLLGLSVLRWVFAFAIVMLPTAAMGMTLPLLAPALGAPTDPARGKHLATVYAANTLGGASGALLGAYWLLPALGLSGTLMCAAAVSAGAGLAALVLGRDVVVTPVTQAQTAVGANADGRSVSQRDATGERALEARYWEGAFGLSPAFLGALAFGSGAIIFTTEVVATHVLAAIVGTSAYAFALILAVFLMALFCGATAAHRFEQRFGPQAMACALAASGAALALTFPAWDRLTYIFGGLGEVLTSFAAREVLRALVALGILIVPTTCMGLIFPLILQQAARDTQVGVRVGRFTVLNTLGAVLGAVVAGYWLLPSFGSDLSLLLVATCFAVASLLVQNVSRRRSASSLAASLLTLLLVAFLPRWDLGRLTAGTNVYFEDYQPPAAVLFTREHVQGGITTVTEDAQGVRTLYTNGKFQGNTGWEMQAQRLFAHYPSLFVDEFERALVIGLGTATTLSTYAAYPWKRIDVVEISPDIVEAARRYFTRPLRPSLDDPRVHLALDDGRSALLTSQARYDLIGMELSSVWFAGAASLYSSEFYALVAEHLTPGGIFQQWVQLHHIHDHVFASIVHTLRQEFSEVALFYGGGQGILVASNKPLRARQARLSQLEALPEVQRSLADRTLRSLLDDILVLGVGLDAYLHEAARVSRLSLDQLVSTDDNLLLEYATPKGNVLPWSTRDALVASLGSYRDPAAIARLLSH